ncbi:MAG: hypothetical protein R3C40_02110 [Parvularculaceae bacterium]
MPRPRYAMTASSLEETPAMWTASVLTLFPDLFPGPLDASVLGRARAEARWALDAVDIRDFSDNPYRSVDDTPAGGGAGLVMRADILAAAIDLFALKRSANLCTFRREARRFVRPALMTLPPGRELSPCAVGSRESTPG